jgi:hypothetical protein
MKRGNFLWLTIVNKLLDLAERENLTNPRVLSVGVKDEVEYFHFLGDSPSGPKVMGFTVDTE